MSQNSKRACWALLLCLLTLGLGAWGWYLDPWIGEMGSGEHPLLLLAVPLLAAALILGGVLGVPPWLALPAGLLAQYAVCYVAVRLVVLTFRLFRPAPPR